MPKFSVLISVYDKANPQHFSEALHSIWSSQTLKPQEIVLVKDGPLTEALDAEIETWKRELGEVLRSISLEKHLGLGHALGIGLSACSHDIVARMDADDIAYPHRFQKQIRFLEQNPKVDIIGSAVAEFQNDPTVLISTRHVPLNHEQILKFSKWRSPFNHPSVVFKKDAVLKAGNYRNLLWMQDYDLWVRMFLNGAMAANMEEPLVKMRRGISALERKGGYRYAMNEYRVQKTFYKTGFLSPLEFARNLLIRLSVRLLPTFLLKMAYRLIRVSSYLDRHKGLPPPDAPRHDYPTQRGVAVIIRNMDCGGAQSAVISLLKAWTSEGRPVCLLTETISESEFYPVPSSVKRFSWGSKKHGAVSIRWSELTVWQIISEGIRIQQQIRKCLRKSGHKVALSFLTVTNILAITAVQGLSIRLVIGECNNPAMEPLYGIRGWLRRLLYRFADAVTACSDQAMGHMHSYVPRAKRFVISNPIEIPNDFSQPEMAHRILNVGRLHHRKNQALIIKALSQLGKDAEGWSLDICGDGDERSNLISCVKRTGLEGRVFLRGAMLDPTPYYRQAGIFVFPSLWEGQGIVLLEAMAHGLACIVSDSCPGIVSNNSRPGNLTYIEDHKSAIVFESNNRDHLVECLRELIKSPKMRKEIGAEARQRMKELSPEKIMPKWNQLLFESTSRSDMKMVK